MSLNRLLQAAFVVLAGVGLAAQGANPLIGTWKLNAAKSKGSVYTSGTTTVAAAGEGITMKATLTGPGGVSTWSFTANYDGKDVPVTGMSPYGDTVALTRVDAHTTRVTVKQAGKVTVTQTIVVAADGKTRTTSTKGTDVAGKAVDAVSLYERQ
ncbi:MAG TPA: hypothetical protein VM093_08930 [Aeromicrobium sp.]|nr:hypothetical protein [Aeromicrobium sp.]